jgi:hypothetical protein
MTRTIPPSRPEGATPKANPRRADTPRLSPERFHESVVDLLGDDDPSRALSFARGVVARGVVARGVVARGVVARGVVARGVVGVLHAAALGVHAIGRGMADVMGLNPKHAIKQVDRLLSNAGRITVWQWFAQWVTFVIAARKKLVVALDWTEFDKDDQATIALYLMPSHGRATPLLWKTVRKSELQNRRNGYETEVIERLHEFLPEDVEVTVLADRGFGDQKLFMYLETLGWSYAIRFRQVIQVTHGGCAMPAAARIPINGHAKMVWPGPHSQG